jgi:hypothetical protein
MAFVAAGAIAAIADNTTDLSVTAPAFTFNGSAGQILLGFVMKNAVGVALSGPAGWVQVAQDEYDPTSGREHRWAIFWKAAEDGDSEAVFVFTQASGGFTPFGGVIGVWDGVDGTPIDASTPTSSGNESADAVTFAAFDPTTTDGQLIAVAFYAQDETTFAATFGTPEFTRRIDVETSAGSDLSIAVADAATDGTAVGSGQTWASNATTDGGSSGVLFALVNDTGGASTVSNHYQRRFLSLFN